MVYTGVVKWFSSSGQAYGYVVRDEGGEIFVHYKAITEVGQKDPKYRVLIPGQRVEFEEAPGHYCAGTQAINVKVIDGRTDSVT